MNVMKLRPLYAAAILSLFLGLTGCGCQHQWEEANCTQPKTCVKCGQTEGEPLTHQVSEWTEQTPSTCTEAGMETGVCTMCGQTVEQELPLADHTPGEWQVKTEPTASAPGVRVKTCTVCGAEVEEETFTMTPEEMRAAFVSTCQSYSYEEIARNPDSCLGKPAKLQGEVIQSMPEGDSYTLRVNITPGKYYWSDTILVTYTKQDAGESNILEDDIITMYGTLMGTYTYESVMGASITVPLLVAEYIDIQ